MEPIPRHIYNSESFNQQDSEPLGEINGKPYKEAVLRELELLTYIKDAFIRKRLVYCK
jgi:hypothetical protein